MQLLLLLLSLILLSQGQHEDIHQQQQVPAQAQAMADLAQAQAEAAAARARGPGAVGGSAGTTTGATVPDRGQLHGKLSDRLSAVYQKLEKMKKDQEARKESTGPLLKHSEHIEHPDIQNDVGAVEHFGYILDAIKSLQAQQITMNHAFNSVQNYMGAETDQVREQQQVLASSFAGLFEHLAQRDDIEEVIRASQDDDVVHKDLEEVSNNVELLRHGLQALIPEHAGQDDSRLHMVWSGLQTTAARMSNSEEITKLSEAISSLNDMAEDDSGTALYFILFQVVVVGSFLLIRMSKPSKPSGLII